MNNILKKTLLIFSIIIFSVYGKDNIQSMFSLAGKYYNEDKIEEAKNIYQKLIDEGIVSSSLFYNMANVYMLEKNYGAAIAYYEKAFKINPSDKDIEESLRKAYIITDNIAYMPVDNIGIYTNTLSILLHTFVILITVSFICIIILVFTNKKILLVPLYLSIIIFLLYFSLNSFINKNEDYAVVLNNNAQVKEAKINGSKTIYKLKNGEKIIIKEKYDNWYYIEIKNFGKGWIKSEDAMAI